MLGFLISLLTMISFCIIVIVAKTKEADIRLLASGALLFLAVYGGATLGLISKYVP